MISKGWIDSQKKLLAITAPGEARDALALEIERADAQLAEDEAVVRVAARLGWIRNRYEGKCVETGERVGALGGFARKSAASARWETIGWGAWLARFATEVQS